jgi:hypothetical protein
MKHLGVLVTDFLIVTMAVFTGSVMAVIVLAILADFYSPMFNVY